MKKLELKFHMLYNGMKDFIHIKKSPASLENHGFALENLFLSLLNQRKKSKKRKRRVIKRKKKEKRNKKERRNKKRNKKRKKRRNKNLKRKKNLKRNKIRKRRKTLMKKKTSQFFLYKKRKTLLTLFLNLHSILMTGKENSAMLLINMPLSMSFGENSIMMDGLFGEFITLNTKVKEKSDI